MSSSKICSGILVEQRDIQGNFHQIGVHILSFNEDKYVYFWHSMRRITTPKNIIISRTDSIGDVSLTLPMCKALKEYHSSVRIVFLGKTYTRAVIEACPYVDDFLDFSMLEKMDTDEAVNQIKQMNADVFIHVFPNKKLARWAKLARIKYRIGTSHRIFHWMTCNVLLNFTRKNSDLHESQLNFELLKPFGIAIPKFEEIKSWRLLSVSAQPSEFIVDHLKAARKVILHCKSQGSAVEWGLDNFMDLAKKLAERGVAVFFTGTEAEGVLFRDKIPKHEFIIDVTGKMTLSELLVFIHSCDVLVAASTGPLHLAGLLGKKAIGLFSPRRPIHPGRWQALGRNSLALISEPNCKRCKAGVPCNCIERITVDTVLHHCLDFQ